MPDSPRVPDGPRMILASGSPRRQNLLTEAGYSFTVIPADIDEENFPRELLPSAVAEHLAVAKAAAVAERYPDDVVIGADTAVAFGDMLLGKATDADDARRILRLLSGTTHIVITGVAVVHLAGGFRKSTRVMSAVRMRVLSDKDLDRYIATNDWVGKAGAYGIQDSDPFVTRLSGSHTNIVGLPVAPAKRLLAEAGIHPRHPDRPGGRPTPPAVG